MQKRDKHASRMSVRRAEADVTTASLYGALDGAAISIKPGCELPTKTGSGGGGGGGGGGPIPPQFKAIFLRREYRELLGARYDVWLEELRGWGELCRMKNPLATYAELREQDREILRIDLAAHNAVISQEVLTGGMSVAEAKRSFKTTAQNHFFLRNEAQLRRADVEDKYDNQEIPSENILANAAVALSNSDPFL